MTDMKKETKLTKKQIEVLGKLPFSMQGRKGAWQLTARSGPSLESLRNKRLADNKYCWASPDWRATVDGNNKIIEYHPHRELELWNSRLEKADDDKAEANRSVVVAKRALEKLRAEREIQMRRIISCHKNIARLEKAEEEEGKENA